MTGGPSMKALRIHAWGEPARLDEIDRPRPGPGEALVEVAAAGLSHFDLTVASGEFGVRPALPYVPGVEGSGTVVESEVLAPGTKVSIRGGGVGVTRPGTWAELVVVPHEALTQVPEGLDLDLAAVAYDPLTTAAVALDGVGRLGSWPAADVRSVADEVVLVTGAAGGVGSVAVQLAMRAGARVIAVVSSENRIPLVPAGADIVSMQDAVRTAELTASPTVTLVVDTVGGAGLADRLAWVRPGGRVAVVGYTAGSRATLDLPNWLLGDVSILPVNLLRRAAEGDAVVDGLTRLLVDGELTVALESWAMSDVATALERLASGRARGKVVLHPGS